MPERSFDEVGLELNELYQAKKFHEALTGAERARRDFPERGEETALWVAEFHTCLGDHSRALDTLLAAQAAGTVFAEELLDQDMDLAPLHGLSQFQRFRTENRERFEALRTQPRGPEIKVLRPSRPASRPPLVVLHGRGSSSLLEEPCWRPAVDAGTTTVLLRSSQVFSGSRFCWDDEARSTSDVALALARLRDGDPSLGTLPVILAGFSQGAAVALSLTISGKFPAAGALAVCPSPWVRPGRTPLSEMVAGSDLGTTWFRLITGGRDFARKETEGLARKLEEKGSPLDLHVEPTAAHAYPDRFAERLPDWLRAPS